MQRCRLETSSLIVIQSCRFTVILLLLSLLLLPYCCPVGVVRVVLLALMVTV